MASAKKRSTPAKSGRGDEFLEQLERATRGLLALNVSVLEQLEKRIGLTPLRALQSLEDSAPAWSPNSAMTSTCCLLQPAGSVTGWLKEATSPGASPQPIGGPPSLELTR